MAMALCRHLLREETTENWQITSAGTWARDGKPAMPYTIAAMQEWGLDLRAHRARSVDAGLLAAQELILVMEANHREALAAEFPNLADRIHLLAAMAGPAFDIRDPVSGTLDDYRMTAQQLHTLLTKGMPEIRRRMASEMKL